MIKVTIILIILLGFGTCTYSLGYGDGKQTIKCPEQEKCPEQKQELIQNECQQCPKCEQKTCPQCENCKATLNEEAAIQHVMRTWDMAEHEQKTAKKEENEFKKAWEKRNLTQCYEHTKKAIDHLTTGTGFYQQTIHELRQVNTTNANDMVRAVTFRVSANEDKQRYLELYDGYCYEHETWTNTSNEKLESAERWKEKAEVHDAYYEELIRQKNINKYI